MKNDEMMMDDVYYHLGPKTAHLVCQVQLESSRCIMLEGAPPSKAYESAPNEYVKNYPHTDVQIHQQTCPRGRSSIPISRPTID